MKSKTVIHGIGYIFISILVLFPIFWGIRTSIAPSYCVKLIPPRITFEHYQSILSEQAFFLYVKNSLIVSLGAIALILPVSLLSGYALARFKFPGKKFGILFLIFPLLPPIAILVPLIMYVRKLGLYNTLFGVTLTNAIFNLPFAVWMVRGFILSIPVEIEEAAALDGCSKIRIILKITIPLGTLGLIAAAAFVFITTWNNYLYAFAFTSSPSLRVLPLAIQVFLGAWGIQWGGLTAAGNLSLIPAIVLFLIFQKWFVAGMVGAGK